MKKFFYVDEMTRVVIEKFEKHIKGPVSGNTNIVKLKDNIIVFFTILFEIEEHFDIRFNWEDFEWAETVNHIQSLVYTKIDEKRNKLERN